MSSKFVRKNDPRIFVNLKATDLFNEYLLPDIKRGDVFPALRDDRIDFYYSGGQLFSYTMDGFKTNAKYAAVFQGNDHYVFESQLQTLKPIATFAQRDNYKRVKENCHNYSGIEFQGVSALCKTFGKILSNGSDTVTALNVEMAFSSAGRPISPPDTENTDTETGSNKKWDRIDLLFYNQESKLLRFVEVKHISNAELWGPAGVPAVASQMERYKKRVETQGNEIVQYYKQYVQDLKHLFGIDIPEPAGFDPVCPVFLLVFGYDKIQKLDYVKRLLGNQHLSGFYYYSCGDPANTTPKKIWGQVALIK